MEIKSKKVNVNPPKKALKAGIHKVAVKSCTTPDFLKGVKDAPPHVVITCIEDGGFLEIEVPENGGYYEGTTKKEISETSWIIRAVTPEGLHFTELDLHGDLRGRGGKVGLFNFQCGSALYWIEPFIDKPTNRPPNGFLFSGYCEPKITKVTWHQYQENNEGPELTEDVKFGDMLQLHIETEGLNGDILDVQFFTDESDVALETIKAQTFGGRLIINFPVKTIWKSKFFNWLENTLSFNLNISVKIINERLTTNFEGAELVVKNKIAERKLEKGNAVPVSIGKVEVDAKKYEMCKYTALKVQTGDREYVIFEDGKVKDRIFEIVAGSKKEKEVTILLTDSNTKVCHNTSPHKDRVLTIDIPDVKYEKIGNRFADTEENEITKEEEEYNQPWEFTGVEGERESEFKIMGNTVGSKRKISDQNTEEFATVQKSDSELTFNARYNYGNIRGRYGLNTFSYFWPTSVSPQIYKITAETCAYKHDISIATYPDIKWILEFKFNCKESDFNKVKRADSKTEPEGFEEKNKKAVASKEKSFPKKKGNVQGLLEVFKRMEISLGAEWDDGNETAELTKDFAEKVFNIFGELEKGVEMMCKIVKGTRKEDESAPLKPKDALSLDAFLAKLNREPQELEVLYPSLAFSGAWWREEIKDKNLTTINKQALAIELALSAKPFIGFELKWDILELLCRKHPLAYIALKIVDGLLILLMDKKSEIRFDFTVSGEIEIEAKLKHNLLAGNALINGYSPEKEEDIVANDNAIRVKLEAKLNLSKTKYVLQYGVVVSLDVGASVESGLGIKMQFGADMKGIYISEKVFFEGLKLSIYAKGRVYAHKPGAKPGKKATPSPSAPLSIKKEDEMSHEELIDAGFEFKGEVIFAAYEGIREKHYITGNEK